IPLALAVACGVLGMVLVVGRDGWLALFVAVAIGGDITLLPALCVIVLPVWLMVSQVPEFRIAPPEKPGAGSGAQASAPPAAARERPAEGHGPRS
ncbi:MAG: hypothetical protein ABWX92_11420, partial [Mycetocola sp.]